MIDLDNVLIIQRFIIHADVFFFLEHDELIHSDIY